MTCDSFRMQTTVAGLEELAQQSKINYTVVEGSPYYEYFKNMASAEEDLYKKWKDMTLSSNVDQARYGFNFLLGTKIISNISK